MGQIVSDTDAEANNLDFDEALESDHDGSGPPPLIDAKFPESPTPRNAVDDVLNKDNDPVPFIFCSSLPSMNVNHGRINHFEPNPVVIHRLLQSTDNPNNPNSLSNNHPTGFREIHYIMLHVLATMAILSPHLLRYNDVVSAHGDRMLL